MDDRVRARELELPLHAADGVREKSGGDGGRNENGSARGRVGDRGAGVQAGVWEDRVRVWRGGSAASLSDGTRDGTAPRHRAVRADVARSAGS